MRIEPRYNGPRDSGNGGWTAGLTAAHLNGLPPFRLGASGAAPRPGTVAAEVTLRVPPPLDVELAVTAAGERPPAVRVTASDGTLVAEAAAAEVGDDALVEAVPYAEAVAASAGYPGFIEHPFPTCFVCGPDRADGDGLRLFPGRLGDGRTATPWRVPDDVSATMVWASLDCPGGWSVGVEARPFVLGRLAARVDAVPAPGSDCVVMGELTVARGRKALVRSTLYGPDGRPLARARATWIAIG